MFTLLNAHMFTEDREDLSAPPSYSCQVEKTMPRRTKKLADIVPVEEVDDFFRPGGKDPLFWCFQLSRGSEISGDIELRSSRGFQKEQELKMSAVEELRKKTNARTPAAQKRLAEAEAELCARPFTRGHGLEALSIAHGKHILYVSGQSCCEMGPTEVPITAVIRRIGSRNSRKHEVLWGAGVEKHAKKLMEELWCLETWAKPMRAVSAYSIKDLRSMAEKAAICLENPGGKPLKKSELYSALGAVAQQN